MRGTILMFCLIGAVFANPISYNVVLESNELDSNSTESLSVSQSSENDTSELQSSEESTSSQSQSSESESESQSLESEDKTSEESNSQSQEDDGINSITETRDDSMGSEENVRQSWVREFASVIKVLSAEDNSSTEVKGQPDHLQPTNTSTRTTFRQETNTNLQLAENASDSAETTSDSADTTSDSADTTSDSADTTSDSADTSEISVSSQSTSSESSETNKTSDTSDSSDASKSAEESNASDSTELQQIKTQDCVNGTQSCESEEYFFQDIGDDAHYSVDNLMVPDEDERELVLRR